jgi:hypothetical protein
MNHDGRHGRPSLDILASIATITLLEGQWRQHRTDRRISADGIRSWLYRI